MFSLATLQLIALSSAVPLRGGFDIQIGMDLYPNEVYGPALESAYRLECDVAEYPRIVVGDNVLQYLSAITTYEGSDPRVDLAKALARNCSKVLVVDYDGQMILHWLSPALRDVIHDFDNRWGHVRQWTLEQIGLHLSANNGKLPRRYTRLRHYLDNFKPPDD